MSGTSSKSFPGLVMTGHGTGVIVADDFTGACDVGVQFAKRGTSTKVILKHATLRDLKTARSVLVYDTETRNDPAETAYAKTKRFGALCVRTKSELVYKKIDSTFRGNVGRELDGILDVFREKVAIVSPTYPEHQRIVVNGILLVGNVPVESTEFASDPLSPVKSSNLSAVVSSQSSRAVGNIYLETVRQGPASIVKSIQRQYTRGIRIICVDAKNRRDLRNIAIACERSSALPCGSAGLAEEIAGIRSRRNRFVILSASTNQATMRELRATARVGCVIKAKAAELVQEGRRRQEIFRLRQLMNDAIQSNQQVIVVASALSKADLVKPSHAGRRRARRYTAVARGLAAASSPSILSANVGAVLVTGGEMAAAFFKEIGAREFELETELFPGVSVGRVVSGRAAGLRVVTKAGGFGISGSTAKMVRRLGLTL